MAFGGDSIQAMRRRKFPSPLRLFFTAVIPVAVLFCRIVRLAAAPADYLVDKWDTEDNLPSSTVTSIAQTPDGYLWAGTYNGLARFDGARFVAFDPVSTPELGQARVQGLFLDANGTLWINTFRGGLTSYRDGVFRQELPDQPAFDLHTTLVASTSNLLTFVAQFGEVLQRDPLQTKADWKIISPTPELRPVFQCADGEGRLWFLTRDSHILQFANGQFSLLADDGGLAGNRIYTLVADARGRVWAGAENEIAVWDGRQFSAMTPTNRPSDIQPQLLFPMKSGAFWVLDGDRFREMSGRAWVAEAMPWRGLLGAAAGRTMGAHEDGDGGLWLNHYGNGLFHVTPDGNFQRLTAHDNLPSERVGAWFQSRDGGIWAGVDHGGLVQLRDRRFHVIGLAEGLPARTALSVCEDKQGVIWIGTAGGGLCRWTSETITNYAVGASASANFVFSILPRPDGDVWLSAAEGEDLFQFSNGQIRRISRDVHGIKSMLADRHGRVWMGTKAGSGIVFTDDTGRRILGTNSNPMLPAVRALAETPDGNIWAGADNGTIFRCEPEQLTAFRPQDALAEQPIYSLLADTDGTLWAGTFRGGLLRFKNGKFFRITTKQGLPADIICQILDDGHGQLWLGTHQGIYRVAKTALNNCADGRTNTLDYVTYGRHDGLPALECSDGYQPACWHGADGKLWFSTVRGVVSVNPDELTARSAAPAVFVEEVRVDGELILDGSGKPAGAPGEKIIVPPGRKQLDFRFTALSFDAGYLARFRYRVDGLDSEWVDLDTRRTVQLRNLPPGDYRFHVIACNSEGVWNKTGAAVAFTVRPFFYQTLLFKFIFGAIIIIGISFAVRRAATRKYRRKLARLQEQHAIERDRTRIAKDIHDDVGAGLTQITLLTELARREPDQAGANLERISESARTLTKAMDEIVWAVDPQHDTFDGLMDYISAYAEDFLRMAGVRCRMDFPATLPEMRVDAELRYNLFLALKESLNNIVKHAKASEVWLRLRVEAKSFTLIIEDNGQGLSAANTASSDRITSGSGLTNMEKRLQAVGGRCQIHSDAGQGTRVEMTVATNPPVSPDRETGTDDYAV
jgi:signal transduction histidine kinase/ligand-binding sensor domain-containing protein